MCPFASVGTRESYNIVRLPGWYGERVLFITTLSCVVHVRLPIGRRRRAILNMFNIARWPPDGLPMRPRAPTADSVSGDHSHWPSRQHRGTIGASDRLMWSGHKSWPRSAPTKDQVRFSTIRKVNTPREGNELGKWHVGFLFPFFENLGRYVHDSKRARVRFCFWKASALRFFRWEVVRHARACSRRCACLPARRAGPPATAPALSDSEAASAAKWANCRVADKKQTNQQTNWQTHTTVYRYRRADQGRLRPKIKYDSVRFEK